MTDEKNDTPDLDRILAEARAVPPEVPAALTSRVMADARALQSQRLQWSARSQRAGLLSRLRVHAQLWRAAGGLVAASATGFWIGVSPPAALDGVSFLPMPAASADGFGDAAELSGFGWIPEEG